MRTAELLAPAGSLETLKAAINAGADAVYIGGARFGARAFADNPEEDLLIEGLHYAHLRGKKVFLTVNTLLKEKEMEEELYDFLLPYYCEGLDAVIVQDLGVLRFIHRNFPGLDIHASTQMSITGVHAAQLLESYGVTRVVTARETSLKEIRDIREHTNLEIESFVHGALCYCYSGQCLLSSMIGGRSGNRGRCAQPCRLPYKVYDDGKQVNSKKLQYVLSTKDMNTIHILPEILEAGVYSLKIEGRMKKPEYTAGVVSIYRKYLDAWLRGEKKEVSAKDHQRLFDLYNRDGFHESYYKQHNGRSMMAMENKKASDPSKARNEELFREIRKKYLEQELPVHVSAQCYMHAGEPVLLTMYSDAYSACASGPVVSSAISNPLDRERVERQLSKTGGTAYQLDELSVDMGPDVFLPVKQLNQLRRSALEEYEAQALEPFRRKPPRRRSEEIPSQGDPVEMAVFSVLVSTKAQFQAVLAGTLPVGRIYVDYGFFKREPVCRKLMKKTRDSLELYLALPYVLHKKYAEAFHNELDELLRAGFSGFLVRNLEELAILKEAGLEDRCIADYTLYTMNREAQAFCREEGITSMTAPVELNRRELALLDTSCMEMIIYGYQVLMVSAQCTKKNTEHCTGNRDTLKLGDRTNTKFTVQCECDFCYNLVYNSLPTGLFKDAEDVRRLGFHGLRLQFTLENEKETEDILKNTERVYLRGKDNASTCTFTKGHFQRGVD